MPTYSVPSQADIDEIYIDNFIFRSLAELEESDFLTMFIVEAQFFGCLWSEKTKKLYSSNFAGKVFGRITFSSFDAQKKRKRKSQLLGRVAFGSNDHVYIDWEVK